MIKVSHDKTKEQKAKALSTIENEVQYVEFLSGFELLRSHGDWNKKRYKEVNKLFMNFLPFEIIV